ncbi:MAG: FG-GAP-like repeat-containing protein, partial [Thermodesulfobacteriota bacterium]
MTGKDSGVRLGKGCLGGRLGRGYRGCRQHWVWLAVFLVLALPASALANFLVAVDDSSRLYYAKSNGDGTFADYRVLDSLGGLYCRAVAINDFDGDGDLDIIAGRGMGDPIFFYLFTNNGSDQFTKVGQVGSMTGANTWAMDLATGDFNNDDHADFLANTNNSYTSIFLGDGAGGFSRIDWNLRYYGRGMDAADFNGDGFLDFARAEYWTGDVYIWPGNGDGTFGTLVGVGDVGDDPYGLAAGDFNNDGLADIIVNSGGAGDITFFAGNGDLTFAGGVAVPSLDFNDHAAFDAFDFNGDGNLDIVADPHAARQVRFYPGNGDGTFGAPVTIGATSDNTLGISAPPSPPLAGTPVAACTPASQTIVAGGTASFDGSASADPGGAIASWLWDFGDGTTQAGSGANVGTADHVYATEGVYVMRLTVTDSDGITDGTSNTVLVTEGAPTVDTTPQAFGEAQADYGVWSLTLDAANYAADAEGLVAQAWQLDDSWAEDFEDGADQGWSRYGGVWQVTDVDPLTGTYSYLQTSYDDRTWNLFGRRFDNDLTIEADLRPVSGGGQETILLYRAMNEKNLYELIVRGRGLNDV